MDDVVDYLVLGEEGEFVKRRKSEINQNVDVPPGNLSLTDDNNNKHPSSSEIRLCSSLIPI